MRTEHFALDELTHSNTAIRRGINNTPSTAILDNLYILMRVLEAVRFLLKSHPIHISSGYRCLELNAVIGGSRKSAHMQGLAADFVCRGFGSPLEICKAIVDSDIPFDQLIYEGRWVHLSIACEDKNDVPRREVLTAQFANGKVCYAQGLQA